MRVKEKIEKEKEKANWTSVFSVFYLFIFCYTAKSTFAWKFFPMFPLKGRRV